MQAVISQQVCPLCRRAGDAHDDGVATRLCKHCRSLIAPIAPSARLVVNRAPTGPQSFWQPQTATVDELQEHSGFTPQEVSEPIRQQDGFDLLEVEPVDEALDLMSEEPEGEEVFYPDVELAPEAHDYEIDSEQPALAQHLGPDEPFLLESFDYGLTAQPQATISLGRSEASESLLAGNDLSITEQPAIFDDEQQIIAGTPAHALLSDECAQTATQAQDYRTAVDPWDDPLPAWDRSQNEWPFMLAPKGKSKVSRLAVPIAAGLVLAAAIYFLFINPRAADSPGSESRLEQKPLVIAPQAAEQAKPEEAAAPQPPPAVEAAQNNNWGSDSANAQAAKNDPVEGRFSLQIASMPNESAANKMAEQMQASGLPAYVVSANLGKRGIWYRVRLGRFVTAEEAQRFAAARRVRAEVARD